jgi:integrase
MPTVNYYLKKAESSNGKSLIYLQFKYNGNRLVFSFGQSVDVKHWNKDRQRIKSNRATTEDGKHFLNDLLDNLAKVCEKAYHSELKSGKPTPSVLRQYLVDFINQNEGERETKKLTFYKLIDRFIRGEIKHKGQEKSNNTLKTYKTTLGHLKEFEHSKRYPIDYNSITLDFLYKFISFLRAKRLSQNAIAKDIQIIKTFMKKGVTLQETTNTWHQHEDFCVSREETDAVYLTENEIIHLYNYDLSNSKKLESVRDLFVFGCFVGLRYSDYSTVKPVNIVKVEGEYYIKLITQKTKDLVIIPCNPIVLKIFDKYSENANRLPRSISNQKFNDAIKDACKLAGLHEVGRLSTTPSKELYNCVSSHTARRSFATNLYLEGFPVIDLMKITGHKTEKAFMRYIRVTKLDAAKRLNTHIKTMWNRKLLRVVS